MFFRIRYIINLIFVLLIFLAFSTLSFGEEAVEGVVVADDVNVRSEAAIDSKVIKNLSIGQYVGIVDVSEDWFKVKLDNELVGWIYSDLIVPVNPEALVNNGLVNGDNVNVRENPDLDSTVLFQLEKNNEVTINEESLEWYNISSEDGSTGWIHSEFIVPKLGYSNGEITGSDVNLRSVPSLEGNVVTQLKLYDFIKIKNYENEWYNIITQDNFEGWIYQDYVKIVIDNYSNLSGVSRSSNRSATQMKILEFAKKYIGTPYKWAGNGPNSFDCSGYTTYVFKHIGVKLPRRSVDQGKTGEKISKDSLAIGDLVFFDTSGVNNGNITHVGIYIGDGEFIHASSGKSSRRVTISNLTSGYYHEKFVVARRVF